ncbi:MAG: DUF4956 domain-containing protein [candidate division Zixibacteria bacterium]
MNKFDSFQQFLSTQSIEIEILGFIFNIILAGILALILGYLYQRYGTSLSNRNMFARNFLMITMTTMVIITIVKSSLALSLGLVGALSIVRFRAAIKEPEELAYLFLAIAVGLGLGADQRKITIIAFILIGLSIIITRKSRKRIDGNSIYLTVTSTGEKKLELKQIIDILSKYCKGIDLKRSDENKELTEASFVVESEGYDQLGKARDELYGLNDKIQITLMDNKGLA